MSSSPLNLQELVGRDMRVVSTDGRVFAGSLYCVDRECNLILHGATQTMGSDTVMLRSVLIPGRIVQQVSVSTLPASPR
jgi:small nuclear ribonucleoprotein (snRNP)-like protein